MSCKQQRLPDEYEDSRATCPACGREVRVAYHLRGRGQDRAPRPFVPAHRPAAPVPAPAPSGPPGMGLLDPAGAEALTDAMTEFVEAIVVEDFDSARRWARSVYALTDGGDGRGIVISRGSEARS